MLNVFSLVHNAKKNPSECNENFMECTRESRIELKASSFDRKFIMASTDNLINAKAKKNELSNCQDFLHNFLISPTM